MTILRAGLYERVSTDEQALRGYSIETQIDNLTEYCNNNGIKIVDHYTDEGHSGAKPPMKRPALHRLLEDVKAGKLDIILFTKLDRWFRSVPEYHKVQEILDKHKVAWKAIHEEYDTTTASGKLAINVYMSISQNESDKGSERVKAVLQHKRRNREASFGGPHKPMGYKKVRDAEGRLRLVKDPEDQEMTQEFWDILVKYNNLNQAIRHMNETHGVTKSQKTWMRIARNPFYCGMSQDMEVDDFCEPYVSKEDFAFIQETAQRRRQDTRAKRVYLFAGLIRCPECGHVLCGNYSKKKYLGVEYYYHGYRCRFKHTTCSHNHTLSEKKIEKYLLTNMEKLMRDEITAVELEKAKPKKKPKNNVPALKERLRRLNVAYLAGNIPDEDYLRDDAEIKALIAKAEKEAPPPEKDITPLIELLNTDFKELYGKMNQEEKRRFWRAIIKEIEIEGLKVTGVKFF